MKKLICFDLDNTLVYSDKAHVFAYNNALEKLGIKKKPKAFLRKLFGRPHIEIAKLVLPKYNEKISNKFLTEHDKILINKTAKYVNAIPGVKKTLARLKKNYDLAILSNCNKFTMKAIMKGAGLNPKLFKILIGNDDVKHSKPYPDEILKAEKLDKHKPEFMIGDSIYDVIAGKKAKVKTIAVLTGNYPRNLLKRYHPTYILNSINYLPKLLKKIRK